MADIFLATAGEDVRLWNMPDLTLHSVRTGKNNSVNYCTISNNGQMVAYANEREGIDLSLIYGEDTTWEIPTACEQASVAFSSNSRFLVSGGKDCLVNIWDVKTRGVRRTFRDHINPVTFCTYHQNDKIVASSSDSGEIILNEVSSGTPHGPLIGVDTDTIKCIKYSHFTHDLLASAAASGAVTLWDTGEQKLLKSFLEHNSVATAITFSPLNDMLLCSTGLDKQIIFYDVSYKKVVKTINTEEGLTSCDFLHDGTTVAVGSISGRIYLFDLRHGSSPLVTISAHRTSVRSVAFQKPPKDKTQRQRQPADQQQQELKIDRSTSDTPLHSGSVSSGDITMEFPSEHLHSQKRARNSNSISASNINATVQQHSPTLPFHSKSSGNLQLWQPPASPAANVAADFFSPIVLEPATLSTRKPVKRSKSVIKKADGGSAKNLSGEADTPQRPGMGQRSKSGLSRLSLLSRSTDDLSKLNKKKDDKKAGYKDSTSELKKGSILPFRSPFRKKTSENNLRSDESETSSIESMNMNIEEKMYKRGKNRSSNRSNDSGETKSIASVSSASKISDIIAAEVTSEATTASQPDHIVDPHQVSNDLQNIVGGKMRSVSMTSADVTSTSPTEVTQPPNTLQIEFIQSMINEAVEESRIAIHNDVGNLQVELVRQMEIQREEIRQMLEHYSLNDELVLEIQRLRAENEMLKKKY